MRSVHHTSNRGRANEIANNHMAHTVFIGSHTSAGAVGSGLTTEMNIEVTKIPSGKRHNELFLFPSASETRRL